MVRAARQHSRTYSMNQTETLITVASWEDRFYLGLERFLETARPSQMLMFYYKIYADWSAEYRTRTEELCRQKSIPLESKELRFDDPVSTWRKVTETCSDHVQTAEQVTIDISTMPRETIWSICHLLSARDLKVQYIYHKPEKYADEWLSRDPGKPRFVYKLAGLSKFGSLTTLVVLTGFDVERTRQLIHYFEPNQIVLGLQSGAQNENERKNREAHKEKIGQHHPITYFDVDGFSLDAALESVHNAVDGLVKDSNVILASLGPKIGALALYKYHRQHATTSLVYAPSNEFNREYSTGYTETITDYL